MRIPQRALAAALLFACLSAGPVSAASPAVERWRPLVEQASRRHGLPEGTLLAMLAVESGGREDAVGQAGELGLLQLLPSTARLLGVRNPRNGAENIDAGARYLAAELRASDGDIRRAVAGFNCGRTCGLSGRWPASTRAYVATVMTMAEQMRAERAPAPVVASAAARTFGPGSRLAAMMRSL